jgi:hypothetical protein
LEIPPAGSTRRPIPVARVPSSGSLAQLQTVTRSLERGYNQFISEHPFTVSPTRLVDRTPNTTGTHTRLADVDVTTYLTNIVNNARITPVSKPAGGTFIDTIYHPPVVLYFYNYDQPAKLEIYQNNNLVVHSGQAANLTDADKNLLLGPGAARWFDDYPEFFMKDFVDTGGGFVTYAGKMNFNYNPASGRNFTIKVQSPNSIRWRYVIAYPIDGEAFGCVPPNRVFEVRPDFTAQYQTVYLVAWCGNGSIQGTGQVSVLSGYTQVWSPVSTPVPTTSVVPFDIARNWYGQAG